MFCMCMHTSVIFNVNLICRFSIRNTIFGHCECSGRLLTLSYHHRYMSSTATDSELFSISFSVLDMDWAYTYKTWTGTVWLNALSNVFWLFIFFPFFILCGHWAATVNGHTNDDKQQRLYCMRYLLLSLLLFQHWPKDLPLLWFHHQLAYGFFLIVFSSSSDYHYYYYYFPFSRMFAETNYSGRVTYECAGMRMSAYNMH